MLRRVERHRRADYPAELPASTSCSRTGGAHARRGGGRVRRAQQLTYARAQRARQPAGPPPARLGVGPETLVGICLERSLELVVGLLGILKAGGAYVPLDPAYPRSGWPSCWRTRSVRSC